MLKALPCKKCLCDPDLFVQRKIRFRDTKQMELVYSVECETCGASASIESLPKTEDVDDLDRVISLWNKINGIHQQEV